MTSSSKVTTGIILLITGLLLFVIGIGISLTVIGACLGVPMIVIGLPLWIWGAIWTWQGKVGRAQEAIAAGVRQGIQQAAATQAAAARTPSSAPPPAPTSLTSSRPQMSCLAHIRSSPQSSRGHVGIVLRARQRIRSGHRRSRLPRELTLPRSCISASWSACFESLGSLPIPAHLLCVFDSGGSHSRNRQGSFSHGLPANRVPPRLGSGTLGEQSEYACSDRDA